MYLPLCLAVIAAVLGLLGAHFWFRSARVTIMPAWLAAGGIEPTDPQRAQMDWLVGILNASQETARLNALGARATAAATIVGMLSVLASAIS